MRDFLSGEKGTVPAPNDSKMMVAVLTFLGISALVTTTIVCGLALSARRAMPTCQASEVDFESDRGARMARETLLAA